MRSSSSQGSLMDSTCLAQPIGPPAVTGKDVPRLLSVLKEMKDGLDVVRSKVEALTIKVKEGKLPTSEGISYLEAKHLLLLTYCQSIVYYLLRKAKGLSIEGHPVVRNHVEIRLFLEKIRPIDKKLEYQIQKLTKAAEGPAPYKMVTSNKELNESQKDEDPLKYTFCPRRVQMAYTGHPNLHLQLWMMIRYQRRKNKPQEERKQWFDKLNKVAYLWIIWPTMKKDLKR